MPFTFQGDFRDSVKIIFKVCIEQEKWRPENGKTLRSLELFCGLVSVCIWSKIICKLSLGSLPPP